MKCRRAQTKNPKWNHCREITLCTLIVESSLLLFFSLPPSFHVCLLVGYCLSMNIDLAMYRHISEVCNEMSANVIFSIVYCMHFIWYFIGAIARSLSEWICSLSRLSNREFDLKGFSCTFHWPEYFFLFCLFLFGFFFMWATHFSFIFLSTSFPMNLDGTFLEIEITYKTTCSFSISIVLGALQYALTRLKPK